MPVVYLVTSGDLRLTANQTCWQAQKDMEEQGSGAFAKFGVTITRGHEYDEKLKHGFIWTQRMGMDVFQKIPKDAHVVVAEAVWQYSYHVLAGLRDHRGPILTLANWSGQWPGLVGMLNLNGSLTKMNKPYSSLWSENFDDTFFLDGLKTWLDTGVINHCTDHVKEFESTKYPAEQITQGQTLAKELLEKKAIMGIFDEGCMGMYNAIFDDELVNACGIYKERLSQSALIAAMRQVTNKEAQKVYDWLVDAGMKFVLGEDEATELTTAQLTEQCKMYIAAVRIANDFSCDVIGIQYQQGLKDMCPASDLPEGLFNNVNRPPVFSKSGEELFAGKALPHFNEVDEGVAVDALVTNRVWTSLGFNPATTLHDIRWGEWYKGEGIDAFVWVFEISGSAPASHFVGEYKGAVSERQPPMYFPLGGGTLKGVSKPGAVVWSRVFIMDKVLHVDIGRATVVSLPAEETERRLNSTTPQWPIMHAVLHGVDRDQLMARHKANHIQVVYAPSDADADHALHVKAAMFEGMGIKVHLCGDVN
eukprot:TRINITY_DN11272_c0_g1_i1.p1 TRINITY_DN11272_c0_g1~~TRINITY_DN11272_c0_g1_i1.p1  ORF type:complete len:559 (+),score=148.14 TRINITY_DN11272_c0_g1_i1:80-1678(+)